MLKKVEETAINYFCVEKDGDSLKEFLEIQEIFMFVWFFFC